VLRDEEEPPPEAPQELAIMRAAFQNARDAGVGSPEAIIEAVLARSLLEPTGKTFFDESKGKFIVVELKPARNELECWQQLAQ
jgi:hypothetical protein